MVKNLVFAVAALLVTGCARPMSPPPQDDAQAAADNHTEVCLRGKVYYAWRSRTYSSYYTWTFAPKIVQGNVTVSC